MHQICAEAGMSPGTLYRYFKSKESIIEAIAEADRAEDAKLFARVLQNPSVVDGVVEGAMAHMRHMHETNAAPLFAEIMAESMRNDIVGVTCRENMDLVHEMFHGYLAGAIERGEIAPVVPLEVLLPSMMSIAHGMALNDLPSLGIPYEKLECVVRATVEGLLRPTGKSTAA
jgi:TetR/AcrR family transcriptional repressor of uid operon